MKKNILLGLVSAVFIPLTVYAAPKNCVYHPLQEIVRSARSEKDIEPWIKDQINFNIDFKCGGSILQLAVLRGNPQILKLLLEQGKVNPNELVPNVDFPILGAPKQIPISFFAAFYAPRADILNYFMTYAGDTFYKKDLNGQNILWYIEQNPVLRNTELSDMIVKNLLITDTITQNEKERLEKERAQKEEAERLAKEQEEKEEAEKKRLEKENKKKSSASNRNQEAQEENKTSKIRTGGMIEEEPDSKFKPGNSNSNDLQRSDF